MQRQGNHHRHAGYGYAAMVLIAFAAATLTGACESGPRGRGEGAKGATGDAVYSLAQPQQLPDDLAISLAARGNHLYVPVEVNGHKAGMFLLDTGSGLNAISQGVSGRLGLASMGGGRAVGIGGEATFSYRQVQSVRLDGLDLGLTRLAALDFGTFRRASGGAINGVIGFIALRMVPFTIDQRAMELTIHRPQSFHAPAGAVRETMQLRYGVPMVQVELGRRRGWVIVDTGGDLELSLDVGLLRRWPEILAVPSSDAGRSAGVGGEIATHRTWVRSLRLFGVELRDVPVSFEPPPQGLDRDGLVIGRVGNRLLRHYRLTFDASKGSVWGEWLPGRPRPRN